MGGAVLKIHWLIRRAAKRVILWVGLGPWIGEYCRACGRRQVLVWHAPDPLWRVVNGSKDGVLCPECFDRLAGDAGYAVQWRPLRFLRTNEQR